MIRFLYMINGFVAILLYLPQIKSILQKKNIESFSLLTFGGWCIGSMVTSLYAWTCVKDPTFGMVSLGNMTGSGTVFCLVAARRLAARDKSDHPDSLAQNFG